MEPQKLDFSALRGAVASLGEALEVVTDDAWYGAQSAKVKNMLIAGVIQNFEFVYELSYKMIKRVIELEAASPDEVDQSSFRDVLRVAAEKGLVADVESWFKYRQMRNITAHTYDHAKAKQVYENTLGFISDARALLERLEGRHG